MGRQFKLITLDSIPPATTRKVKKALKTHDTSLEAADAKMEYATLQLREINHQIDEQEKKRPKSA